MITKGSRACLGINLAYMEMFMTLGSIFRMVDASSNKSMPKDGMEPRVFVLAKPKAGKNVCDHQLYVLPSPADMSCFGIS